jgi:tetratricopeptide (TPR) repeat protein
LIIAAFALAFVSLPTFAQKNPPVPRGTGSPSEPPTSGDSASGMPMASSPGDFLGPTAWGPVEVPLSMAPIDTTWLLAAESCNSWTESSTHGPTVSVTRLAVPGKASSEYQKGCGALKDKKLSDAEEHERSAIRLYPSYAAAWVLLGQVLDAENKRDDGRMACSQARSVDPSYVAPYLCLANFAATEENWQEVSMLSGSALTLDPAGNAYSFYYAADAAFHLGDLTKAEKDAQNSITLDKWRHLAQAHLLLAEIYKAKADLIGQAAQLREYLKIAPNSPDSAGVKTTLAQLQAKPSQ